MKKRGPICPAVSVSDRMGMHQPLEAAAHTSGEAPEDTEVLEQHELPSTQHLCQEALRSSSGEESTRLQSEPPTNWKKMTTNKNLRQV